MKKGGIDMKKNHGRYARTFAAAAALLVAMLLTGCGEQKKYEQAAALEAEGNYHEAWQLYFNLGRKNYKDAAEKAENTRNAGYQAAQAALAEGRYDDAETIAKPFPYMDKIVQYAQTAKEGTYVRDLTLSEDGKLSFTAAIADGAGGEDGPAKLQVLLRASGNRRASGAVYTAPKEENDTGDGYFVPEDYLKDGEYVISDVPLDGWVYDAAPRSLTIVDYHELADSTLEHLQFM